VKFGIIGGGIMGITLGYLLSKAGNQVSIFEASSSLGGLAGPIVLEDGVKVDRFYHAILSSDKKLFELCKEVGLSEDLRFRETKMGFFHKGNIHPMNNLLDFLKFPPLGWIDRFRLGLTILYAQIIRDWHKLESISVEEWLKRLSGNTTYQNIWQPLLKAKFDGGFENTPATYIWSRLVRMKSTRGGVSQKEMSGHLIGGFETLLNALADRIKVEGGNIFLNTPVEKIIIDNLQAKGIKIKNEIIPFDAIISTVQTPVLKTLIPNAEQEYLNYLSKTNYLGIVVLLLVLDRPLSGYWTTNITDGAYPFTGIIETTAYIDPMYVGNHHLVYLPKYTLPDSNWIKMADEEIKDKWLDDLSVMFPNFERKSIKYSMVQREVYVEPIHELNHIDLIPSVKTPIKDLYLATTAQIYPSLTNGEAIARHAEHVADEILGLI
jgi:protoporphyrinogen oxidase